jgi:hypothetical protein
MVSETLGHLLRIPYEMLVALPKQLMAWMRVRMGAPLKDLTDPLYVLIEH